MKHPKKINLDTIADENARKEMAKLEQTIRDLYEEIADLRKQVGTD